MKTGSLRQQTETSEVGVYDCEIHLKFRLVEDKEVMAVDSEQLLELLLEALSCGADDCLETLDAVVDVQETSEVNASPRMRRQLMRLRNSLA
ncbi:MAG: Npun_R1517 family heterocyst differentiation transcriptional regulator [Synechococcales cyanobacterium K44_A2020_017]|jgi:hypothetical protein|uniref:Npun_R1517 family heterocyst differentiation transcriptional regulator n=1 Tax=Leptolyngbya sp. CCY15150 TaxID=2767772 RepID=UPI0019511F04|nr:Npun_R1517 family heterocyst differentiation transcriptional regulator [Leptolyngbya sp. CCY15150]MBF2088912.1 Npun_R1517 family heterocyst differentiation transcriptional regulator [Synechococcales cyanobacterium K32_A2020_035]MBF2093343.1 Npun_R1517 family heterocyst differentiation transcriptional regulator [Synechococcales cyanobacterium K44_A2020_017]